MDYKEKWEQLKELLTKEVDRLEAKEEYRQSYMHFTEGQIATTKFVIETMDTLSKE